MRLSDAVHALSRIDLGWRAELPPTPATNRRDLLDAYVVTGQDPAAGLQAGIDYAVDLDVRVTDGLLAEWREPTVVVPYASGQRNLLSAYDRLHARGLRVTTDSRLSYALYLPVLDQRPSAGTEVRRGTTVTLRLDPRRRSYGLGLGQDNLRSFRMPDLSGRSLGDAVAWFSGRHLYWELVDAPALPPTSLPNLLDAYVVVGQHPRAGMKIPQLVKRKYGVMVVPIKLRAALKPG